MNRGEKKRASIGVELVTNPSLIFMDEPTTGMDTFTAQKIVEIIRNLTRRQRSVKRALIINARSYFSTILRCVITIVVMLFGTILYYRVSSL